MIKYVDIEGYNNRGEIMPYSHVYQFLQTGTEKPLTIIVHAYECDTKAFKGYLFCASKTYQCVPLTVREKEEIEGVAGKLVEVTFEDLIKDTLFAESYSGYAAA